MSNHDEAFKRLHETAWHVRGELLAGEIAISLAATEASKALANFRQAWDDATRRHETEGLFLHPDVIDLDLDDAYWRPQ